MKISLTKDSVIMSGNVLAGLEYVSEDAQNTERATGFNQEKMLEFLRANPRIGNELLSYSGPIYYMGESAKGIAAGGKTLGVKFADGGSSVSGDNVYGQFLMDVREAYRRELGEGLSQEVRVRPGQVISDYVSAGEYVSEVERMEQNGRRFIHTEPYRPVNFNFDAAKDGTTGHNRRATDSDVVFQTFECPFGLSDRSKLKVNSAVEVSLFYEQALRGELDWPALFEDLKKRGNIMNLSARQEEQLMKDMVAQFDWMREEISRNNEIYAERTIVSELGVIPDSSFGRSIYDPELAPSPAHILARYINNPSLLFTGSENGVMRALEATDKAEAYRFSAVTGNGRISIVIDGSDTIGGREPKTRAIREKRVNYKKDERGKFVYNNRGEKVVESTEDTYKMQFKSEAEIEVDYAAFKERLSNIVANVSPEVKISFITGKGVGTPSMVTRFIKENGGQVFDWDYTQRGAYEVKDAKAAASDDARFSQLRMQSFQNIQPVLVGRQEAVSFLLDRNDEDSRVEFRREDGLSPKGYILFSVDDDARNNSILQRGTLALDMGLPLVHVQNNRSEEEQKITLASEASLSRSYIIGEQKYSESLFKGRAKKSWKLDGANIASYVERDNNIAIPYVGNYHNSVVYVNGVPFHTIFGAFTALMARESGVTDAAVLQSIARDENSMAQTTAAYANLVDKKLSDDVIERCMRNSVHMMAGASEAFSYMLLNSEGDFVMPSTFAVGKLFTDIDGKGENRFGVVFNAEREALKADVAAAVSKAQVEESRIVEENNVRNKVRGRKRARGEKMSGGLPADRESSRDAIWFLGTNRPSRLCDDDFDSSTIWEEANYGKDALNRELASRPMLDDGEGGKVENRNVFLFPSDLQAVSGRRKVMNNPDGRNLTGVVRMDPATGKEFTCAFGIPVKKDNFFFEQDNNIGRACSYLLDKDSTLLVNGLIEADSLARKTAIEHNMSLCYAVRERPLPGGDINDDLSRNFIDKVWDYPRSKETIDRNTGKTVTEGGVMLPKEVTKKVYNHETMKYESVTKQVYQKQWIDNPHASRINREIIKRYEAMLDEGVAFPLNCICMPKSDYSEVSEEKFLADFSFALKVANASALAQGLPMRFPLDENGRLDLGPDVPENFRDLAERKLDSFIGVVREENIINDELPYIRRVPIFNVLRNDKPLKSDGSDIYLKPLDLVQAFGGFDFGDVKRGLTVPLHEMAFVLDDGTAFSLMGGKLTSRMQLGEINRYVRYDRNDEQRFYVKSSDPERIPEFLEALRSYIERAKRVSVETKLVTEQEAQGKDFGMAGFVNLLSSNSEQGEEDEFTVAARGAQSAIEAPNRFDGSDNDSVYYGKEDANDAFAGYAMVRATLPDGTDTGWKVITDREVALDVIYSKVQRKYRSDVRELTSEKVLECNVRAFAIDKVADKFRKLTQAKAEVKEDTKVVHSERFVPSEDSSKTLKEEKKETGRLFVSYYGSKSVPKDAIKVQISTSCPEGMKDDMDFRFESLYPNYNSMVGPHKNGAIDDAEYSRRYQEKVLDANKDKILDGIRKIQEAAREEGKDAYLFCYCAPGNFCHRYLVNNFLNENGIVCQENPTDRQKYTVGHVQLFGEEPASDLFTQAEQPKDNLVTYTLSDGNYQKRTYENANADDVDFTFQFKAVDSYGERSTEKAAGDSCLPIELPFKDGKLDLSKKAVSEAVNAIMGMLPEEFFNGTSCGVNLAGNGIYTLNSNGMSVSQNDIDVFVSAVFAGLKEKGFDLISLRSGGQTGVDEAAVAVAHTLDIPVTIHGTADWRFRPVDGKDVSGNEHAFKERFVKDFAKIKSNAEQLVVKKTRKVSSELKR